MKIAILTPTFSGFSGPDRVVWNEASELSKKHDVTIYCFSADLEHPKATIVRLGAPKNKTIERFYKLLFFLDILKMLRLIFALRKFDKSIAFLYPMTVPAAKAKFLWRTKYTYYDVGLAYPWLFSGLEKWAMRFVQLMTKLSVWNADDVISISKFCADEVKKLTGKKARVKYVAIDTERFNRKIEKKKVAAIKKRYSRPILIYTGRISPHKGIHLLLKAFAEVRKKEKNATLLIIGKHTFDGYSEQLKKLPQNGVVFTGFVPDEMLPDYYHASDLYVTASLWEGFDMPCVEAQACGKKVAAFDVGSHPEVVKKGTLVEAGNADALASAILSLLH